jgi:hypothetical protein
VGLSLVSRRFKEIKVKIPIEQHLRLHTLKLTQGVTISEAVEKALQKYLDEEAPDTARRLLEFEGIDDAP